MLLDQLWQKFRVRAQPFYEQLGTDEVKAPGRPAALWLRFRPRGRRVFYTVFCLIFVFLGGIALRRPPHIDLGSLKLLRRSIEPSAGYLHVLVPAGHANSRFCRTALSGAILGYPVPLAINWEGKKGAAAFGDASWEIGKFKGVLDYLEGLEMRRADDLVLIVDGEDSWFQLKPEVLIHRFRDIIKNAEKHLHKRVGGAKSEVKKPEVVFAASKQCHSGKVDNIGCYATPDPPAYTSTSSREVSNTVLSDNRPRFLSSTMVMGTVSAMRSLHQAGWDRWQNHPGLYSGRDDLFASFFGEQEYQREQLRSSNLSLLQRLSRWLFGTAPRVLNYAPPNSIMYAGNLTSADHGITLDYTSSLAHITTGEGDWVRYSEPQTLHNAASAANLSGGPPSTEIDTYISYSRPPLWTLAPYGSAYPFEYGDLPKELPWISVPLYTNLLTSITPVIILNANSSAQEPQLLERWKRLWFKPYMRKKMANLNYEPQYPLATTSLDNIPTRLRQLTQKYMSKMSGQRGRPVGEKQWWNPFITSPTEKRREGIGWVVDSEWAHAEKGQARGSGKEFEGWKRWGEVCGEGDQDAIIGDGKGRWVDRKVFPPFPDIEEQHF